MNKTQRLRNAADGFMAGLVMAGYGGPFRYSHLTWELPFYGVWRDWSPRERDHGLFPCLEVGGSRTTSQARDMLSQLKSTSPFTNYRSDPLPAEPAGMSPAEFIDIFVEGASPDEWMQLAQNFLEAPAERTQVVMADGRLVGRTRPDPA